jgi:hypothetical protein
MLQAILINKAGRSITSTEVHWRQLFTASEDSLTSTIFGTLLYLPRKLFWQILHNASYHCTLPNEDNKIESIEYWPHWKAENSKNLNFIEPDIFLRTSNYDLIVEAKRYDYDQQNSIQWLNEFHGYLNHYSDDAKTVFLLAIGGISNECNETFKIKDKEIKVIKCRWARILNEIKRLKNKVERNENTIPNIDSISTILDDLIIGFRIHGYATGEWFENTEYSGNSNIAESSLTVLSKHLFNKNVINWRLTQFANFRIEESSLKYFN